MADFASLYGIRLLSGVRMSWPEFSHLLAGALATESRLSRHFAPKEPTKP